MLLESQDFMAEVFGDLDYFPPTSSEVKFFELMHGIKEIKLKLFKNRFN